MRVLLLTGRELGPGARRGTCASGCRVGVPRTESHGDLVGKFGAARGTLAPGPNLDGRCGLACPLQRDRCAPNGSRHESCPCGSALARSAQSLGQQVPSRVQLVLFACNQSTLCGTDGRLIAGG